MIGPDFFAHLSIFLTIFFLALGFINVLPEILNTYREGYQTRSRRVARELSKFFIQIKPTQMLIAACGIGLVLGFLARSWVVAIAIMATGLIAPRVMLTLWKEIRSTQFEAQLMDALLLIANSLRSGLDMIAGIERVANNMKPPISEEFGLVMNAYRLGTPLETSLVELTQRINSRTLETVVSAICLQRETGGNIIRMFDQLVTAMREESKLQKKVRAMTSQGRAQVYFLAGFPWALGFLFMLVAPDLMEPVFANTWGQMIIVFLIVWEIIGIFVTKKIVEVDV